MITKYILTLVLGIAIATPIVIFFGHKEKYDVILMDGEHFKARQVNWYNSGQIDIIKEDGERILVPERQIKKIKVIDDKY